MDEPMEDSGTESQGKTEETGVKSRQMPLTMGSSMGMKLVTPNHEPGPGLRLKDTNPITIGLPFTDGIRKNNQHESTPQKLFCSISSC